MTSPAHHNDVGAYAIGALDAADTARFEEHLAVCQPCANELDELLGLGPLLAEYREGAAGGDVEAALVPQPSSALLDRLLDTVSVERRKRRVRRLVLVAAAVAVLVAGPFAGSALLDREAAGPPDVVQAAFQAGEKFRGTDPETKVDATVALTEKRWGTEVAVRLAGVSGPQTCGLVAVGKDGSEQTVTTWAVPEEGYGWEKPAYYVGGAAYDPAEIDRFEVRTLDGERLVTVPK
ncbi:zf-HC2 domain-containing protein [Streptomyces durbertensis]|uniref:Zf-HC2 domain-containing protein n=1 Tax=Streptomyces durbertensis TaxID=2448886 RepID=A0ABR6EDE7_9ACTN|nr:zf-HC2 domain-containing protein [Streptomyces durbertensis]MBB1243000.1 zf-HC2 domain-containing protein [Streptomyces durbertensis]